MPFPFDYDLEGEKKNKILYPQKEMWQMKIPMDCTECKKVCEVDGRKVQRINL